MYVSERHAELEKCRQLTAFKYLERKSQLPNEALIGTVYENMLSISALAH